VFKSAPTMLTPTHSSGRDQSLGLSQLGAMLEGEFGSPVSFCPIFTLLAVFLHPVQSNVHTLQRKTLTKPMNQDLKLPSGAKLNLLCL
jgi:hypothetical protein